MKIYLDGKNNIIDSGYSDLKNFKNSKGGLSKEDKQALVKKINEKVTHDYYNKPVVNIQKTEETDYSATLEKARPTKYIRRTPKPGGGWNYEYADKPGAKTAAVKKPEKSRTEKPAEKPASQTDSPEFKKWFGDSKVVDENGKPLVVYHGTDKEFTEFRVGRAEGWGQGIYFTNNKKEAEEFGKNVRAVYLKIENPYYDGSGVPEGAEDTESWKKVMKIEDEETGEVIQKGYNDISDAWDESGIFVSAVLREMGFDGVIADSSNSIDGFEYVAFSPTQIKSSTGNSGKFDPNEADMTKAKDTTKLIKKTIINKLGKQQTVYVKMMDEKKEGWLDKFSGLFGFKQRGEAMKKLETDYKQNGVGEKFGLTWDGWKDHVAEYMKNKDKWAKFFNKGKPEKAEKKEEKPADKKPDAKKGKPATVKLSVMKLIHGLYGNVEPVPVETVQPVQPVEPSPDNFDTMPEAEGETLQSKIDRWKNGDLSGIEGAFFNFIQILTDGKTSRTFYDKIEVTKNSNGFIRYKTEGGDSGGTSIRSFIQAMKDGTAVPVGLEPETIELDNGAKIETKVKLNEKQKTEQERDEEQAAREGYFNEKPSEILNVGTDVWGAARHNYDTYEQFNADIKQMESDGTATAYVTKKNLLGKNGLENKDERVKNGETDYKVLASFCVRDFLPKLPPDNEEARSYYMDFLRAVVRFDNETTDAAHFFAGLTDTYSNMFPSLAIKGEDAKRGQVDVLDMAGLSSKGKDIKLARSIVGDSLHMLFTTFMQNPDRGVYYGMDKKDRKNFNILSKLVLSEKSKERSYEDFKKDILGRVKTAGVKVKKGDNFILAPDEKEQFYKINTTYKDGFSRGDYIREKNEISMIHSDVYNAVNYSFDKSENKVIVSNFLGMDDSELSYEDAKKAVREKIRAEMDALNEKYLIREKMFPEGVGEVVKAGKNDIHVAFKYPDGTIKAFNIKPESVLPENIESVKKTIEKTGTVKLNLKIEKNVQRKGGKTFSLSAAEFQQKLASDFQLKSVQYGNSMPDAERIAHTKWAMEAFSDLSDILNLPLQQISVNGRLGVAFGARGRPIPGLTGGAAAHYEPQTKMINLTRANGIGSLAHEWGHFLDNILTPSMQSYLTGSVEYESKRFEVPEEIPHGAIYIEKNRKGRETRYFFDKERFATRPGYPLAKLKAGQTEPNGNSEYMGFRSYQKIDFQVPKPDKPMVSLAKEIAKKNQEWLKESCDKIISESTSDVEKMQAQDLKNHTYLNDHQECFARAFEAYVADKLESQGRKNTYLSSVEKTISLDGYFVYPQGEKRKEINQLFDKFFDELRGSGELKKAISRFIRYIKKT